ncbi:peptidylprolyl isomerase [Sporosarcina limicola]|uniref:Foldase protein PrsA n=1 Tax=Sporosarcina limicola TaxID=34101 RepID=A0A927R6E7_9BACL|nr:peptidylprolyl isomerase [Sporosarcina limicola]MBE1554909.1 foldase protein PrsA [Sporosarcina limicola]
MKKTMLAFTMAASVLALSACNNNSADDAVLVKSKAGNVTKNELYEEMKSAAGEQTLQILVLEKVLNAKYKISDKQVEAEVNKAKEQLGESFEPYLAQQKQTEDSFRKGLRLDMLQKAALTDGIEVTDEEFDKRIEEMNTEINAKHVLVADEKTALEVKKKLEGGEDFAKIAKEYSTDPGSKDTGGKLDWFGYGKMVKEFWDAAYVLELNKISEPIRSQNGFHIIQVTEKRKVEAKELTKDEQETVRNELKLDKADTSTLLEKVTKLMKDADVKVEDKDLKSALDMFLKEKEPVDEKDKDKK